MNRHYIVECRPKMDVDVEAFFCGSDFICNYMYERLKWYSLHLIFDALNYPSTAAHKNTHQLRVTLNLVMLSLSNHTQVRARTYPSTSDRKKRSPAQGDDWREFDSSCWACRSIFHFALEHTLRLRLIKNIRLLRVTFEELKIRHTERSEKQRDERSRSITTYSLSFAF